MSFQKSCEKPSFSPLLHLYLPCEEPSFSPLLHQKQLFSPYPALSLIQVFIGILSSFFFLISPFHLFVALSSPFILLRFSSFLLLLLPSSPSFIPSLLPCFLAHFLLFVLLSLLCPFSSILLSFFLPYPLLLLTLYLSFH